MIDSHPKKMGWWKHSQDTSKIWGKTPWFPNVSGRFSLQESWWPVFFEARDEIRKEHDEFHQELEVKQWSSRCHSFDHSEEMLSVWYPQHLSFWWGFAYPQYISFVLAICTRFSWICTHFHWILAYLIPTFSVINTWKFPAPGET